MRFPEIGEVDVLTEHVFYDRPVLFTCRNALGSLYMVVLSRSGPGEETWTLVQLSEARHESILRGEIDLYSTFKGAESGQVLMVTYRRDWIPGVDFKAETISAWVPADSLDDADLPDKGETLTESG